MLVAYDLETVREGEVVGVNRNQAAEVTLRREGGIVVDRRCQRSSLRCAWA